MLILKKKQNGYKHMIIEERILNILGEKSREWIKDLKRTGLKTEPAFTKLLKLQGDPYDILLEMYEWDDKKLKDFITNFVRVNKKRR